MSRLLSLVALLVLIGLASAKIRSGNYKTYAEANAGHAGLASPPMAFDRIFIIQFENQGYDWVKLDPNFHKWSKLGTNLTNYYGIIHPSQPNYWTQVAGDYFGIMSNFDFDLDKTNLADLLEARGISWKTYQEAIPTTPCYTGTTTPYYRKHNPFISFNSVRLNATRCAKIVHANQLDIDLSTGRLPQYSYYTPDMNNDGHDTSLAFAGQFLDKFLSARLNKFPRGTLIVVTYDEDNYIDGNHISTFCLGSMITPGTFDNTPYNHYSLLRTVEDNFSLGNLGRGDASANSFQFLRPASNFENNKKK